MGPRLRRRRTTRTARRRTSSCACGASCSLCHCSSSTARVTDASLARSVRPPKPGSSSSSSTAPIYTFNSATSSLSLAPSHPTLVKRFGSAGQHAPRALSDDYEFRFDLLHLHPSPTSDLYDARVRPVVRAALAGFNGTVFACALLPPRRVLGRSARTLCAR